MTLYKNRDKFSSLSIRIGEVFSELGLTPNQWTFMSLVFAVISVYFITQYSFLLAGIFVLITIFLDVVDGSVARATRKSTTKGAYLDTVVDRYVEAILILGLLVITLPMIFFPASIWLFLYFFGSIMTTYVKAAAKEKDLTKKEIKGGLIERTDRMIILLVGIFLASLSIYYLAYVVVLLAILSNITVLQRIGIALR